MHRITIVTDAWHPQVNGVVRSIENTILHLGEMGADIRLITPSAFRSVPCPTYPEIRLSLVTYGKVAAAGTKLVFIDNAASGVTQGSDYVTTVTSDRAIIGARTASGRRNIGKSVELFGLCQPGLRFVNPVNGVMTQLPASADRALWLVTGDVYAFDNQHGFAFVRAEHLMPLTPDQAPQMLDELTIS